MKIQNEIDELNTLKKSFSKIANSYSSLVPKEFVTVQLHAENIDLSAYKIKVVNTTSGNEEFYDISASGYTEFEVKYDSVYEIVFPIIGACIAPATRTFTAQKPMRKIEASYVMAGVFGLDEQGNKYSLEQIAALADKSIIKYGGFTNETLENVQKVDGAYGCGFMWELNQELTKTSIASSDVEFNQELLPFLTTYEMAMQYPDGEAYTQYILSEGVRLGVNTPAATLCTSKRIYINGLSLSGYLPSYAQLNYLGLNITAFKSLYATLGITELQITGKGLWTSNQYSNIRNLLNYLNSTIQSNPKSAVYTVVIFYPLPK